MVSFSFDRDDHYLQVLSFTYARKCYKDQQQNSSFSTRSTLKAEISPRTFLHIVQTFKIPLLILQTSNALLVQISFQDCPAFLLSRNENLDGSLSVARSWSSRAKRQFSQQRQEMQLLRINEDKIPGTGNKRTVSVPACLGDFYEHALVKKRNIWGRTPLQKQKYITVILICLFFLEK